MINAFYCQQYQSLILDPRQMGAAYTTSYERFEGIPEVLISKPPTDHGPIPDPSLIQKTELSIGGFSDTLSPEHINAASTQTRDITHINFLGMRDGSPLIIPRGLEQFAPTILMAAQIHYAKGFDPSQDSCLIKISQGPMCGPGDSLRGCAPHADFNPVMAQNGLHIHDVYMVSDIGPVTTIFLPGECDISGVNTSKNIARDLSERYNIFAEMVKQREQMTQPPANHLIGFDSRDVHQAVAHDDVIPQRTFLQIVFMPNGDVPSLMKTCNPALDSYLALRPNI
jgi:hypothetical protein